MKVMVYVEGPSDKAAMRQLLGPLLEQKKTQGIAIDFFEAPMGDKKESVLTKVPQKAVNILRNDPAAVVIAVPDLYPRHKAFPHETEHELFAGIQQNFAAALHAKGLGVAADLTRRFQVFCFKHDLEALLLAAEEGLKYRLRLTTLKRTWRLPVEAQNHDQPPKRVIEKLFNENGQRYQDTVDAPLILSRRNYQDIAAHCPQCFKPFVDFLERLPNV